MSASSDVLAAPEIFRGKLQGVPSMGEDFLVMLTRNGYLISLDLETGLDPGSESIVLRPFQPTDSDPLVAKSHQVATAPLAKLAFCNVPKILGKQSSQFLGLDLMA